MRTQQPTVFLATEPYLEQRARWPARGRHVLAQYDHRSVVVYQAYRASIAEATVAAGRFGGGGFGMGRMSWIKPNFLWMMYRCGWAQKAEQERVLAVRVARAAFDAWLAAAVHSSHVREVYGERAAWERAVKRSDVRLQWDPDHDPGGAPQERRALQLGLRGAALAQYAGEALLAVEDITDFVHAEHARLRAGERDALVTPRERVYPVRDVAVAARLGLDPPPPGAVDETPAP